MPEWASLLVGLGVGVAVTLIGTYYGEWLHDRRERRKVGREVIAKARVLLQDASPKPLVLVTLGERQVRRAEELWERWRELRLPFLEFVAGSSGQERESGVTAANSILMALETYREAAVANRDRKIVELRRSTLLVAETCQDQALRDLDDFNESLA